MPSVDSTGKAALEGNHAVAWFIWIDFNGDPLRITTFGQDVAFVGTADADLNGNTFLSFDHRAIDVSDVNNSENGSDTVTITLSGVVAIDDTLMAGINDPTIWRGRICRLWFQLYDDTGTALQGAIVPYYTGYGSQPKVIPGAKTQTIQFSVENYLAASSQASNRSYLNQKDYDANDNSAQASLAAANMGRGHASTNAHGGSGRGGGGGGHAHVNSA